MDIPYEERLKRLGLPKGVRDDGPCLTFKMSCSKMPWEICDFWADGRLYRYFRHPRQAAFHFEASAFPLTLVMLGGSILMSNSRGDMLGPLTLNDIDLLCGVFRAYYPDMFGIISRGGDDGDRDRDREVASL